jgi:hypothetical protein
MHAIFSILFYMNNFNKYLLMFQLLKYTTLLIVNTKYFSFFLLCYSYFNYYF